MRPIIIFCFFYSLSFASVLLDLPNDPDRYFSTKTGSKSFLLYHRILGMADIAGWEILLLKPSMEDFKIVRRFDGSKYFSKKVKWDGKHIIQSNKESVQIEAHEGLYYYTIRASNRSGETIQSPFSAVVLDNSPPLITLTCSKIFSPNNDDQLESLPISITLRSYSENDTFAIEIFNNKNSRVKTYPLKVQDFERNRLKLQWDGSSDDGSLSPEARYFVQAVGKDFAGNVYRGGKHPVDLVRALDSIEIKTANSFFIYENNKDSFIRFDVDHSSDKHWEYEIFTLKDIDDKVVLNHSNRQFTNYLKIFPRRFLPEGDYIGTIQSFYTSGNFPISKEISFSLFHSNYFFVVADRDVNAFLVGGKKNVVNKINFLQSFGGVGQIFSIGQIRFWEDGILGEVVFTTNFEENLPESWTWQGEANTGSELVSGEFAYQLKSKNELNEKSEHLSRPFSVVSESANVLVSSDNKGISPNGDNFFENLTILFDMPDSTRSRFQEGYLTVYQNKAQIKIYSIKKDTQKIVFPQSLSVKKFPDTSYNYFYTLGFNANEIVSGKGKFYIDTNPIEISAKISVTEKPLSLDKEDINEIIIKINTRKSSKFQPGDQLTVSIYSLSLTNESISLSDVKAQSRFFDSGELIWEQRFDKKLPKTIKWDGKSQGKASLIEGIYAISLGTEDILANSWVSNVFFRIIPRF